MWKASGCSTPGRTLTIEKVVKTNGLTKSRRSVIIQLTLRKSLNYTSKILKQNQLIALSIFHYILIFFLLLITIKNFLVPMSLCCNSHASPLSWSVRCYLKLCAKGRNNSQHCWANNVGRCCVRVGDGMQTDATTSDNLRTCSTRGKDTTHETFLNTLILSWRVRGPNNVGRAVQTDPTLLRYASTITEQKKCWELFAQKFNSFQTSRYSMQKSVKTDATCNTQQWCVRLHGAMRSLLFIVEEFVRVVNMLFIIETSAKVESCKLGTSLRASSPIWASEASLARTRERGAEERRACNDLS